ncbi:putative reverse transcriptase domain-containing protein [Tanacetum coccineum]
MKNQKYVARPPRSMTCKNCGETGHNKNCCEKPKVPDEQANPPNEQANPASQQGNPPGQQANPPSQQANLPKKKGRPMVNDLVNARVSCRSKDKFVTARGGIWMGGTSATGSNRGRGSASGSNRGRGSASGSNRGRGRGRANGSNKVFVQKSVLLLRRMFGYCPWMANNDWDFYSLYGTSVIRPEVDDEASDDNDTDERDESSVTFIGFQAASSLGWR